MNLESLKRVIKSGEKLRVELKETPFLASSRENRFKIARQLVAFANRNGGHLVFGIKNDGSFEGKRIDEDREVQKIAGIAKDKCSPPVVFTHQFLSTDDGDVLVIEVKRRDGIPHAIVERGNHEIKSRTYFIRTPKGVRLVDNTTLEWLFGNIGDPSLSSEFQFFITYNKRTLGLPVIESPTGFRHFREFFSSLSEKNKNFLSGNGLRASSFAVEIAPYALLKHLATFFSHSWQIEIFSAKDIKKMRPKESSMEGDAIKLLDIKRPANTFLSELSLDISEELSKSSGQIMVPKTSKIEVFSDGVGKSSIRIFKRNCFSIEITFLTSHWMVGLPISSPLRFKYQRAGLPSQRAKRIEEQIATITLHTSLNAQYDFPDIEDPYFNEHFAYGRTIQNLLEDDWNWDKFYEELPNGKLYSIEDKIDEILKILGNPS